MGSRQTRGGGGGKWREEDGAVQSNPSNCKRGKAQRGRSLNVEHWLFGVNERKERQGNRGGFGADIK